MQKNNDGLRRWFHRHVPKGRWLVAVLAVALILVPLSSRSASAAAKQQDPVPLSETDRAQAARDFIQNLGDQAIVILADKNLTAENKDKVFRDLMHRSFDLPTIGRFVIGRNVWLGATETEREEYLQLFERLVIGIYSDRFALYNGQRFHVADAHNEGDKDTIVTSHIMNPGDDNPIVIDWRVRSFEGRLGIIDMIVEGVSMSVTQRQEYASVLSQHDNRIGALLDVMRQRLDRSNQAVKKS